MIYWKLWGKKQDQQAKKEQEWKKKLLVHITNFSPARLNHRSWQKNVGKDSKKKKKAKKSLKIPSPIIVDYQTKKPAPKSIITQRLFGFLIIVSLIVGSYLLYTFWTKWTATKQTDQQIQRIQELEKEIADKTQKIQKSQQLQKNWIILTNQLANDPKVNARFANLLKTSCQKFTQKQSINTSQTPLEFGGFYVDESLINANQSNMGRCLFLEKKDLTERKVIITINQIYLLNKLGHEQYFPLKQPAGDYLALDINFIKLTETISHELAHYFQFAKYGKSSCENDSKFLLPELVKEHQQLTKEIKEMIVNLVEYEEFMKWWQEK